MRIELDQLFIALPELLIIQFMKKDNVSRDSFMNRWEVIQPAKEGKLEVSYRWFRSYLDAQAFYFGLLCPDLPGPPNGPPFDT